MANLYDISEKLDTLINEAFDIETGELYETQEELDKAIDECELDLDTKIENIGLYIKNLTADIEMLKHEEDNLKKRRKSAENKIESLKQYLNGYLTAVYPNNNDRARWKFKTAKVMLGYRKSNTVEVPDIDKLDKNFLKVKTEVSADKIAIKDAIKNGQEVKGAFIQENINLNIK